MKYAHLRFYAELNDLLPARRRQVQFSHAFTGRVSLKDLIEGLGVPHTEVELVLVNGHHADLSYLVCDDDRVSIFPAFRSLSPPLQLDPRATEGPRFVLDGHLGRLARYLRLLGFDTLYSPDFGDEELAAISVRENRILISRDRGVLKRKEVTHGYCLRAIQPDGQVREVIRRYDLEERFRPFSRCLRCNRALEPVDKREVADRLPPFVRDTQSAFQFCPGCGRIYWPGTHFDAMSRLIAGLTGAERPDQTFPRQRVRRVGDEGV